MRFKPKFRTKLVNKNKYIRRPYRTKMKLVCYLNNLERRLIEVLAREKILVKIAKAVYHRDFTEAHQLAQDNAIAIHGPVKARWGTRIRHYSPEFRAEIVRRVLLAREKGHSLYSVAAREGIPHTTVDQWVRQYQSDEKLPMWKDIAKTAMLRGDPLPDKESVDKTMNAIKSGDYEFLVGD